MFSRSQAEKLLEEILRLHTETDEVECKTSPGNAFQKAVCAAANRRDRNGGIVYIGVSETCEVVGVPDIEATQKQVVDQAADVFNFPLRVSPEILDIAEKTVIAVIVPPCPAGFRPCYLRRKGVEEGSYIRSGNSTREMTRDEVRREIAADEIGRGTVAPFDRTPSLQAPLETFDEAKIQSYVSLVKQLRPTSKIDVISREQMLYDINAIAKEGEKWFPTPTGILFFSDDPQRYLPQSSVEFMHLWGPELTSLGPDGSRWRLNKEITGTLPEILLELEALLYERGGSRSYIDGFQRRNEPDYPKFALREAVVNAVAHRDYALRGSHVQVRLYPDRLEVDTPGGLPPPVTVDNLEDEKSTRNEAIVPILQDYNFMERRGYGIDGMIAAMREAGLAPPQVRDNGSSFSLTLKNHVLLSPEAMIWLRRYKRTQLTPQERLTLAYLRVNERLYNRDYVRLAHCTSVEATQALRQLVSKGVLTMHSTRGAAYYTLAEILPEPQISLFDPLKSDEEQVIEMVRKQGRITVGDCITEFKFPRTKASKLLRALVTKGLIRSHGKNRWTYYTL